MTFNDIIKDKDFLTEYISTMALIDKCISDMKDLSKTYFNRLRPDMKLKYEDLEKQAFDFQARGVTLFSRIILKNRDENMDEDSITYTKNIITEMFKDISDINITLMHVYNVVCTMFVPAVGNAFKKCITNYDRYLMDRISDLKNIAERSLTFYREMNAA